MQLTFLEAAVPLTKKYIKRSDGRYDKTSYPLVSKVTSHTAEVEDLAGFSAVLDENARKGFCLHTGSLDVQLEKESRAGHHDKHEERQWIVLDLDGLGYPSIESFISELPRAFHDVSYIAQHSASSGLKPGLNMHLFFMLDRPEGMAMIRDWLKFTNLDTKSLSDQITLTASDKALSFKLDIIANANGRVIYIAPPECEGFDDPVENRVELVQKRYNTLRYNFASVSPGELKAKYRAKVDNLRSSHGMPKLRAKDLYEDRNGTEVLRKDQTDKGRIHDCQPDSDTIMRCNVDGGDSHAYFYYVKYPQLVRNHKGEPALYMEAIDPNYFQNVALPASKALWEKDIQPFVFRNENDDKYYAGLRRGDEITSQPRVIGSPKKMEDYFSQHGGLGVPDPIETWSKEFNPSLAAQWNDDKKIFNTWRQSEYMANATFQSQAPPVISKVIYHALGGDDEAYARFINWVAFIYQKRRKTGTAWLLQGVQGTGKGLLVDYILAPIMGRDYVVKQQARNMKAEFNAWMEHALIVNIDEFNLEDAGREAGAVLQAIKMWVTDENMPIRAMHTESRQVKNFSNFILTTNTHGAIKIDEGDRRMNFGVRQEKQIDISADEVAAIKSELYQFAGYLKSYNVDTKLVTQPLESATKELAKQLSLSTIEEFVRAIDYGNLDFFMDAEDARSEDFSLDADYKRVLEGFVADAKAGNSSYVSANSMFTAYRVICGCARGTKTLKFKKIMAHKNLAAKRIRIPGEDYQIHGWKIDWRCDVDTLRSIGGHIKAVNIEKELQEEILAVPSAEE